MHRHALSPLVFVFALTSCDSCSPAQPPAPPAEPTPSAEVAIERLRLNQLALRLELPLFWVADTDEDGAPDPDEVRSLRFYPTRVEYVRDGAFTPAMAEALDAIRAAHAAPEPSDPRVRAVTAELDHAAPTLVETDLATLPEPHRAFARHMLRAGEQIDRIYARQTGMEALRDRARALDVASRSLFRRNWGPLCRGATTERDEACSAIPGAPQPRVDAYPAALQESEGWCQRLEARADATALLAPFVVVRGEGDALRAVPYTEAYAEPMQAIASELRAAADAMTDAEETALVTYLRAAATSFETNDWTPADEAWSRMSVHNSRWYLRIAPDETYWDPCSQKAGFHMTLALINRDSLTWQARLAPIQRDMERALAELVPGDYAARDVAFHMPDFIDIVVNSGDARDAFGATIGPSLPNWGPVADEGRGRTVAMSNLYTDGDSMRTRRRAAMSLLSSSAMESYTNDAAAGLLSTILHEATHNLGPSHEYEVRGQVDTAVFGGGLASMLEELKAQSGALFFVEWLRERGVLTEVQARQAYVDSIVWAFGHISRGMYTPSGQRKAYSQLAAVQVGFLLEEGALAWDPDATAADGESRGAMTIDFARFAAAARALMTRVMHIKATGDRADAEALAARYVDGEVVPHTTIVERYRAFPQAAFVYSVRGVAE